MATEVKLPRLGQGMESGTIVRWLKAEGDSVKKREPLYELDTDKVTQEVESDLDGILLKILVQEGEVEVGSTIAMIENGDSSSATVDAPAAGAETPASVAAEDSAASSDGTAAAEPAPTKEAAPVAAVAKTAGGRIKASPLARRIARERGVDLAALDGTGPDGRIVASKRLRPGVNGQSLAATNQGPAR